MMSNGFNIQCLKDIIEYHTKEASLKSIVTVVIFNKGANMACFFIPPPMRPN